MLKVISVVSLFIMLVASIAVAQEPGDLGVGIILGEPTGLTGKVWLEEDIALDAACAWSFEDKGYFHLHTDYLFHDFDVFDVKKGRSAFYYGPGIRVKFSDTDKTKAGIRAAAGITHILQKHPLDVFIEIAILLDLVPSTKSGFNAGIGFRYYFH